MPLSFDEWLTEQYGAEGEPVPVEGSAVDEDISNFVGWSGDPNEANGLVQLDVPQVQPTEVPMGTKRSAGVGESVSTSSSGYNLSSEKTAQINKAMSPLDTRIAQGVAGIENEYSQTEGQARELADAQQVNAAQRGSLDMEKASIQSEADAEQARIISDQVFQEKLLAHGAQLKEEEAMSNWVASMKAYEASNINPGKMWGDMTGGERFGTAISVFAHNVLAAKGINTSVMSSLNRAIDDNLNAQMQNMNKKERVAGQFKQVYEAVRMESESEAEARAKMRALMMTEFRAGVTARLSSMDSDYAKLKAQEWAVAIEADLAKQMAELRQIKRQDIEKERNFQLARISEENQLRMQQASLALSKKAHALEERKYNDSLKPVTQETPWDPALTVRDPATINDIGPDGKSGAVGIGQVGDKTMTEKLQNELNFSYTSTQDIKRLGELSRELGSIYSGVGKQAFLTKHKAELESIRTRLNMATQKQLTGLTATDQERAQIALIRGNVDNWLKGAFSGDSDVMMWTQTQNALRERRDAYVSLGTKLSRPGDTSGKGVDLTGTKAFKEIEAVLEEARPGNKPTRTKTEERLGEVEGPGAWEKAKNQSDDLVVSYGKTFGKHSKRMGMKSTIVDEPPQWAAAMHDIYQTARNKSVDVDERSKAAYILSELTNDYEEVGAESKPHKNIRAKMGDNKLKAKYARDLYQTLLNEGYVDIYGNLTDTSIEGSSPPIKEISY